jgi:UDP-3-O-[3-hydroxymyristoyl] glucosamine N-acyltransferase
MPSSFPAYIDDSAELSPDVIIGPYAVVGREVLIGSGTRLGAHVVIHEGTRIGAGCEIQDHAVLGKPPKLARHSSAPKEKPAALEVADGAVVCCGAIVFAGATVGQGAIIGDQAYVRERAIIGPGTVIGRGSAVDNDVTIGARVRVQTDVYLTANTLIEDDVFVGPGVCTTNDSTMARHDEDYAIIGARLRRACRVGGGVVVCPGVEIGEEAFVAAGAVVAKDLPARGVGMGVPARNVREVGHADLVERWR